MGKVAKIHLTVSKNLWWRYSGPHFRVVGCSYYPIICLFKRSIRTTYFSLFGKALECLASIDNLEYLNKIKSKKFIFLILAPQNVEWDSLRLHTIEAFFVVSNKHRIRWTLSWWNVFSCFEKSIWKYWSYFSFGHFWHGSLSLSIIWLAIKPIPHHFEWLLCAHVFLPSSSSLHYLSKENSFSFSQ